MQKLQETQVQSLNWEDLLEEEIATHSSIPFEIIPWTEEHGSLQSLGLQWVRHDWVTPHSLLCLHKLTGFVFRVVLDLQENWAGSTEFPYTALHTVQINSFSQWHLALVWYICYNWGFSVNIDKLLLITVYIRGSFCIVWHSLGEFDKCTMIYLPPQCHTK